MLIHLDKDIFENVKYGTKSVEVRVNDEKRRKIGKNRLKYAHF